MFTNTTVWRSVDVHSYSGTPVSLRGRGAASTGEGNGRRDRSHGDCRWLWYGQTNRQTHRHADTLVAILGTSAGVQNSKNLQHMKLLIIDKK